MSSKKVLQFILLISMLLICFGSAAAQATEFTYQGRLLFGDVPANGSYDFEFALFDADTSGTQLGSTFPLSAVNVNNGVFSVRIDFGNQFPGASRFLEIHVRQTGTTTFAVLAPRQAISSSPYAIKSLIADSASTATNASLLGGVKSGNYVLTSDTRLTDSRNPLPNSSNYIQNATSQQALANFNISGNGTAGGSLSATAVNATSEFDINGNRILSVPGNANTFVGSLTGSANMVQFGKGGTFVGNLSGESNTTGLFNSFFGDSSGSLNTNGSANAFIGRMAGGSNTGGSSNSAVGANSGVSNTTGNENSFFGVNAGDSNTIENGNTFLGSSSNGAPGISNATAIGFRASVAQSNSLVLGAINGLNGATADTRVGIGTTVPVKHLHIFGGGDQEVAIQSSDAGGRMWTLQSSQGASNGRFEIIDRTGNASRLAIDLNGNVGISDSTPAAKLDIAVNSGQILAGDAGCNAGFTGIGFATSLAGCTNFSLLGNGTDTIINRPIGGTIAFRENNVTQMSIASGGVVSITTPGSGGTTALCRNASGQISTCSAIQGEGTDTFVKSVGGTVHLRTAAGDLSVAPTGTVTINGLLSLGTVPGGGAQNLCLSGSTVSLCSSSIRYKTNIKRFTGGLDLVRQLRPVTFNWRSDNSRDLGLVAEDVARIDPLLVTRNSDGGVEGVKYDRVGVVLVNAVNEQQSQIEAQQKQIDAQKQTIEQQQAEIDALKKLICLRNRSAAACRPTH
jgi:hypothetical protein